MSKNFGYLTVRLMVIALMTVALTGSVVIVKAEPAAPQNQATAALTEDYYFDTTVTFAKVDSGSLRLSSGLSAATRVAILRFNVSTPGSWAIDKARLNLAYGYVGSCTAEPVNIQVYGTSNGNADPPTRGGLLASIDGGTAQVPNPAPNSISEAYQHWTDSTPVDGLVQYLEIQRGSGGIATLWVETTAATGSVFFAASNSTSLNTSCGSGAGGAYTLGPPVLQLADPSDPLAVTLSTFGASDRSVVNWPLYVGLAALTALIVVVLLLYRRRAVAR